MIEVAGGILLALLILFLVIVFFRSIALVVATCVLLVLAALLSMTEIGRTLLSVVAVVGVFGGIIYAIDKGLAHRDAVKRSRSKWRPPLR
jgi:hypothetical protein